MADAANTAGNDDGQDAGDNREEQYRNLLKYRLRCILRNAAAVGIEADIASASTSHPNFVRAFEFAPNDYALIVNQHKPSNLPTNPTSRLFTLWENMRDSDDDTIVPMDGKSFGYVVVVQREEYTYRVRYSKHFRASLHLTPAQVQDCQILLISSFVNPNWIALVPRFYFEKMMVKQPSGNRKIFMGNVAVGMAHANPLPPVLAPFVMHRDNLPEAYDNILAHVADPRIRLRNPYSGLQYRADATVDTRRFHTVCGLDTPEIILRYRLWKAFDEVGAWFGPDRAEYQVNNPLYAPFTSDLRLDHLSGSSVSIELKQDHAKLSEDGNVLSHLQFSRNQGRGIFAFSVTWDYLLTMVEADFGYLIKKDDIPMTWWHQDPGPDGWLTEHLGSQFLQQRKIDLTGTNLQIVSDICRGLRGEGSAGDPPVRSHLTDHDITRFAGLCPLSLLLTDAHAEKLMDLDDADADNYPTIPSTFGSVTTEDRSTLMGGRDSAVDAQLFMPLMEECRRTGLGCMIHLGVHHPFGRMAMVKWTWSRSQKDRFDKTGQPPCWVGMLSSNTPIVALNSQWSKYRASYAPEEGTVGQVEQCRNAHPCIQVLTSFAKEMGHQIQARWVIPSEFMPTIQYGDLKGQSARAPLLLEGQRNVEEFMVAEEYLHRTIYAFLQGHPMLYIGSEAVPVDPRPYLKSIGEFKRIAESKFEQCGGFEGQGKAWNKIKSQGGLL